MIGQVLLGKYKVTRQLDEGGMSKIWLARQAGQARDVVVKMLKEPLRSNAKAVEHFRRELFILSRLSHPNLVTVFDSQPRDLRGPILVMEHVVGTDLGLLVQKEGRLPVERVGRLLGQLCDVLQSVHAAGIIHRDLKPGNVMIASPGTPGEAVKLMDFGLAKMAKMLYISPDEMVNYSEPTASGTPEYISPEMVRGNDMDARSDLYSVGVMLYEMLAGRRPFHHADVESLMVAHAREAPPRFADIGVSGIKAGVEAAVMRCLAKYPQERFATAHELAQAFGSALGKNILPAQRTGDSSASFGKPLQAQGPAQIDGSAHRQAVEVSMPEAMAVLKIKGFIYDLGGEVVESMPGLIKVRLQDERPKAGGGGLLGWFGGGGKAAAVAAATDMELHMERRDPSQGNRLTITLTMKRLGGSASADWRERCKKIGREMQSYLMG
ncbi:MAG: serine/threonine protein kinase [Gemmataceae bacterium]|nr:serine/threonine protein kinase [Gemmataceae bacterium]